VIFECIAQELRSVVLFFLLKRFKDKNLEPFKSSASQKKSSYYSCVGMLLMKRSNSEKDWYMNFDGSSIPRVNFKVDAVHKVKNVVEAQVIQ
jgi:hypothetical protein